MSTIETSNMHSAFPKRLKAARLQAGTTQATLATAIGVSKQAISQFEHGRKSADPGIGYLQ